MMLSKRTAGSEIYDCLWFSCVQIMIQKSREIKPAPVWIFRSEMLTFTRKGTSEAVSGMAGEKTNFPSASNALMPMRDTL